MKIDEAIGFWGKNVAVVCVDGQVVTGPMGGYQTHADEPESIDIFLEDETIGKCAVEIPVEEIASITEV